MRGDFYAVLARLLVAAPDAEFLRSLAHADELIAADRDAPLPRAWKALRAVAGVIEEGAVRDEYDALFLSVGKPQVVLYGSYYVAGFMMEEPLAELRGDLADLGLVRRSGVSDPEDHIAALADVMRYLIGEESLARGSSDEVQQRFFRRHLQPWYGRLCDALEAAEHANFYRHVGRFARAFLNLEGESFEIENAG